MKGAGTPRTPEELSARADGAATGDLAAAEPPPERPRGSGRGAAARRQRRLPAILLLSASLLVLLSAPLWAPLFLRRLAFFRVRRVEIVGARYVAPADILARLHVDTLASVWDATGPLARRVAALSGIRSVDIRRKLPGTLVVDVAERVPIALVPTAQGFRPYDASGVALPIDPARILVDAPIVRQRDVRVLRFLAQLRLEDPALYQRVSEVRDTGRDELVFELLPAIPVRAMKNVTVQRLADIEPVESDLARRRLQPAELDLRYRDQVIARLQ